MPIPFEQEADAKKFLKEHKGEKIMGFKEINLKLIHALDNPKGILLGLKQ